ncbi:hypothetical protein [Alloactinosynnema sp. L-07]|nr:hypothetical protein [Alloactinosynnema sp. L-07]
MGWMSASPQLRVSVTAGTSTHGGNTTGETGEPGDRGATGSGCRRDGCGRPGLGGLVAPASTSARSVSGPTIPSGTRRLRR